MILAKTQIQAWIGYAVLGLMLATGSLAVTFYAKTQQQKVLMASQDARIEKAETRVATVEDANATQALAIQTIRDANERSGVLLQNLSVAINNLDKNDKAVRNRLDYLEKNDAAVRDYFNIGVPPAVACLLDKTCDPDGNGLSGAKQRAAGEVPRTSSEANKSDKGHR